MRQDVLCNILKISKFAKMFDWNEWADLLKMVTVPQLNIIKILKLEILLETNCW